MKKRIIRGIILLYLWLLPVLFPAAVYASEGEISLMTGKAAAQQEQFQIHTEYGWKGMSSTSRKVPTKITVTNNGPDFQGTLKVRVSSGFDRSSDITSNFLEQLFIRVRSVNSNRNQTVTHEIPVTLASKESKTWKLTLSLAEYDSASVGITIEDKNHQLVSSMEDEVMTSDPFHSKIIVGIVETDNSCAERIDGMEVGELYQITAVSVAPEELGEELVLAKRPDVLIFLAQSEESLDEKQRESVERWKNRGGILIDFWDASYTLDGAQAYVPELIRKVFRIEPRKMMEILLSQEVLARLPSVTGGFYDPVYENSWILEEKAIRRQPDSILFIALIFGYAILAGPVLYLILKKRKKRKYLWAGVCMTSSVFVVLIAVLGKNTVMQAPVIVYKNSLFQKGNELEETLDFEIQAPYNSGCKLYLDSSYQISMGNPMNSLVSVSGGEEQEGFEQIRVHYGENQNEVEIFNQPAFALNAFELSRTLPLKNGGITANFRWSDKKLCGTVVNNSGYDLKDCVLLLPGHMAYVGDLKNKEILQTDEIVTESVRDSSEWLEQRLGKGDRTRAFCAQAGRWSLNRSEDSLLIGAVDNWNETFQLNSGYETQGETFYTAEIQVEREQEDGAVYCPYAQEYYATDQQPFTYGKYPGSLIMDGQQLEVTYYLNAAFEESILREESIARLFLEIFNSSEYVEMLGSEGVSESLDYIRTLMQNPEEMVAMQEANVELVEFSSPKVLAQGWEPFKGTIEVYNYSTGVYEVLEDWKLDDNSGRYRIPSPYFRNGNTLTVRYTLAEEELSSAYYKEMGAYQLPDLTVKISEYTPDIQMSGYDAPETAF